MHDSMLNLAMETWPPWIVIGGLLSNVSSRPGEFGNVSLSHPAITLSSVPSFHSETIIETLICC